MLSSALAWREVTLDDGAGHVAGPFYVGPATVRTALAVLEVAAPARDPGHPEHAVAVDLLDRALTGWLPYRLADLTRKMSPKARSEFAEHHLSVGAPTPKVYELAKATVTKTNEGREPPTWDEILVDYRAAFSLSLPQVLDEPWPAFLGQAAEVRRHQATEDLRGYARMLYATGNGSADGATEWLNLRRSLVGYPDAPSPAGRLRGDGEAPERPPGWEDQQAMRLAEIRDLFN